MAYVPQPSSAKSRLELRFLQLFRLPCPLSGGRYTAMVADQTSIGALLGLGEDSATGNYFFTPPSGLGCSISLALNANESMPFV